MKKQLSLALALLISISALSFSLMAMRDVYEEQQNIKYRQQCLVVRDFLVQDKFSVDCNYNYHHYNASPKKNYYNPQAVKKQKNIRIAGFNLWHPGSNKTVFKDFEIVAHVIN